MTPVDEHLHPSQIDAFADRELTSDKTEAVQRHIAVCHVCTLLLLETMELKRATAAAGRSLAPPSAAVARLTAHVQGTSKQERITVLQPAVWMAIAASLILVFTLGLIRLVRGPEYFAAELVDQHLGTLSVAKVPEVLSSDRHTVKPWFQGKLPFTFNLPEPAELPANTELRGADQAYLNGDPAALLLFTMHQHRVSVFMTGRSRGRVLTPSSLPSAKSGFSIRSVDVGHLRIVAVSDVNPADLERLLSVLDKAQAQD